jgi:NAD(P)-dependent dehydrogenase (short-subunit alcohol dehydrogenase family)
MPSGDRTALVIGASRGIGRATADELASAGYRVWTASRGIAPGPQAHRVDVQADEDAERLRRVISHGTDGLDVLVITAGSAVLGRIGDITPDDVSRMLAEHVVGGYRITRALRASLAARRGHVIFLLSRMGRAPRTHGHAYGTAKAALAHLAGCLALDLADDGIRVNCVSPGAVDTDLLRVALPASDPLRALRAEQVARLIVELAGPAFAGVNGAVLDVPGPLPRHDTLKEEPCPALNPSSTRRP